MGVGGVRSRAPAALLLSPAARDPGIPENEFCTTGGRREAEGTWVLGPVSAPTAAPSKARATPGFPAPSVMFRNVVILSGCDSYLQQN